MFVRSDSHYAMNLEYRKKRGYSFKEEPKRFACLDDRDLDDLVDGAEAKTTTDI